MHAVMPFSHVWMQDETVKRIIWLKILFACGALCEGDHEVTKCDGAVTGCDYLFWGVTLGP